MKPSFIEESSTRSMLAIVKFVKKLLAQLGVITSAERESISSTSSRASIAANKLELLTSHDKD